MKISSTGSLPFLLLTAALVFGLTLPVLIQDGMFMDAMLYTSVAHNMARGYGTFWFPQFSFHGVGNLPSFHEQPPLVFGIQSIFFRVLGDSLYVERFYTFLALIITAVLIMRLWKEVHSGNPGMQTLSWLPVACWIILPTAFWSYSNNMLENTMGIFTLLAVLSVYRSLRTEENTIAAGALAGLFVFLASFSKGLPGLFPLAVPLIYAFVFRGLSFSRAVRMTWVMAGVTTMIYLFLLAFPGPRESLYMYFVKRALHRIQDVPTVTNRWYTLTHIFFEILPQLLLILGFILFARPRRTAMTAAGKQAAFFGLTGLAASLPLMLTLVQKSFYYVPALPYLGIALALFFAPLLQPLLEKVKPGTGLYRRWISIAGILLAGVFTITLLQAGKSSRDRDLLHDVHLAGEQIPKGTLVALPHAMYNEWDLQCYFMRYFQISIDPGFAREYCIAGTEPGWEPPPEYRKLEIPTIRYHLYRRSAGAEKMPAN
jgi:4-amino-4-deoxy-L-arabinose transferase-like glycosyltransferase